MSKNSIVRSNGSAAVKSIRYRSYPPNFHFINYNKHWKRQQLLGRVIPDPDPEWVKRLAACVAVAEGQGLRGRCVVRNGSRDCGNASAAEAAAGVNESGES